MRLNTAANDPLQRGKYRAHLLGPGVGGEGRKQHLWYEIADLRVAEVLPQQVGVAEACVLFYARRDTAEAVEEALRGGAPAPAGEGGGSGQGV